MLEDDERGKRRQEAVDDYWKRHPDLKRAWDNALKTLQELKQNLGVS